MSAIGVYDHKQRTIRFRSVAVIWSTIATALFLSSAVLQTLASLQRWIVFRNSQQNKFRAEDHLFDYYFPVAPWENIGTAAQLFGIGTLLLALGVVAMAFGVVAVPRITSRRRVVVIILGVIEIVIAILVAGSFAVHGAHAFLSGVAGTPSSLQQYGELGWIALVGLAALAVQWWRRSPAAMMACLLLLGSTGLGYYLATFFVASLFAGYASHDTTPWTETILAAWTAAAGVAMIFAAMDGGSSWRTGHNSGGEAERNAMPFG